MLKNLIFSMIDILPEKSALRLKKRLVSIRNSSGTLSERISSSKNAFEPLYNPEFKWINSSSFSGSVPMFSHTGSMGDILFSLYFCKELTEHLNINQFDLHIQTNVLDSGMAGHSHPCGNVRITSQAAEFIQSLLLNQPYIRNVSFSNELPENAVSLDKFREIKLNLSSGQIQNWYYNLTDIHLPREFWKPILSVEPNHQHSDKVILSITSRYRNVYIDCKKLEKYCENLIFAGTQEEYQNFCKEYFELPCIKADNLLTYAQFFAGAKGFIGNQGGLYTTAECLKIPRILIAPEYTIFKGIPGPGPHVNHPQGGWCEDVSTTEKMLASLENLLKK